MFVLLPSLFGDTMKKILSLNLLLIVTIIVATGQSTITPYYERNDFLLASPGAMKFGLYGYDNPALLTYIREPDILFTWSDAKAKWDDFKRWGLFVGIPHMGFGVVHNKTSLGSVSDYSLSFSSGNRKLSTGIAYGWTRTANAVLDKSSLLTMGTLFRPLPLLSIGASYISAINVKGWEIEGDVAVRPFGNESVAAFTEYVVHRTPKLKKDMWCAGVALEAMPGVRITGRYFDTKEFSVGFQFSLGNAGFETQAQYDRNQKYSHNTYGIRLGAYDRNILAKYVPSKNNFIDMNLYGSIDYQRYVLFDKTQTLNNILMVIDAAKTDPSVGGIAINTSGMETDREKLWEIREKLKDFKTSGKKVFIFIDRGDIDLYHFASVADKVVMDPIGTLIINGYVMGRTFLKGTLEKIGIGYDEWRFFKYKSAAESFSRDKMSDADREQRQKLIDGWYKIAKEDICEARHLSFEQFDKMIDEEVIFTPQQAKERGLIDSVGRWDKVKEMVKAETDEEDGFVSSTSLKKFHQPYDNYWGEPPRIAIIYALGACDMEEGIAARKLVKDVETAVDDLRVKAIVLRIDSPGGDPLASDYIAEALKKAKGKKPIIVSQGFVAASGGYWLSMYADTIVAAPGTITGSIGVIGGWMYNKGFKESIGMSTDLVKVGAHSDLGFGFRLPIIGIGLPDRNFTTEERAKAEMLIKSLYNEFVEKVSLGRKKTIDQIEPYAQGRVWTGIDGKEKGLVDVIGGIETAIAIAKERAGISKDQEVTIIERITRFRSVYAEAFWI
jgi:protease-4